MDKNNIVITRTPLRITFCGGGTDIPEYYKNNSYGCAVNSAINKYIYVTVNKRFENNLRIKYSLTENVDSVEDIKHPSVRESLKFLGIKNSIEIDSISDIPSKGTGLGSSSTFLVGLLNGLHNWLGEEPGPRQLAEEAVKIEREILKEAGGKQDQYVAAYGGLNYMRFKSDESVEVRPIRMNKRDLKSLEASLLLLYTGGDRSSSAILEKQKKAISDKTEQYTKMRTLTDSLYVDLEMGNWKSTGKYLDENWKIKRSFEDSISNGFIDNAYNTAISKGAEGGKLVGAGGSGFLLLFADKSRHDAIMSALPSLRQEDFRFEDSGSSVLYKSATT